MEITNKPALPPTYLIFLDIDGVMIESDVSEIVFDRLDWFHKWIPTTDVQRKTVVTNYFPKRAIDHLDALVAKTSRLGQVGIVISSQWKNGLSLEDLKHRVFADFAFGKHIIGKTEDSDQLKALEGKPPVSPEALKKYGFRLENDYGDESRGRKIEYWLRENKDQFNVRSFVVLDACDNDLSSLFPKQFVQVKGVLSQNDVHKAYAILNSSAFSESGLPSNARHKYVCPRTHLTDRVQRTFIDTALIASSIIAFCIHDAWTGAYRLIRGD
jgi:hypothetical protein